MIAHHDETAVDALIRRLERDGFLRQALNIRNHQHQVNIASLFTASVVIVTSTAAASAAVPLACCCCCCHDEPVRQLPIWGGGTKMS